MTWEPSLKDNCPRTNCGLPMVRTRVDHMDVWHCPSDSLEKSHYVVKEVSGATKAEFARSTEEAFYRTGGRDRRKRI